MASRNLSIPLVTAFNDAGLKKAQKQLEGLGGKLNSLSNKALKAGAAFAAFQGGRALVDFASGAIEQSRDLERNMNGLQAVFGELTPQMVDFTEKAHKMGLSQSEAAKSVTFIGSVLKQSGFAIGETAALTERLIGLGTDLSITYGYDVQEALLGMTALFRGEYDPIEKFGVAMKQSEIDAEKAARGLGSLTGSAERLADQQIRLELLFERSADAQGQYQKQSESLFVAQQNLEATFKNMQATAGQVLTPAFADLTLAMTPLVERLTPVLAQLMRQLVDVVTSLTNNTDELEDAINGFANGVIFVVGGLAKLAQAVINNITLIKNLAIVIGSLFVAVKAIQGLVVAMQLLTVATNLATKGFKLFRTALITSGIGAVVVGLGFLAEKFMFANDSSNDFADDLPKLNLQLGQTAEAAALAAEKVQYFKAGLSMSAAEYATRDFVYEPPAFIDPGTGNGTGNGGSGQEARDYVAEFYAGLKDEVAKQEATLKLEKLGASAGLIQSILGSGEEWQKVFDDVIKRGKASVAAAQLLFNQSSSGIDEITKQVEEYNAAEKAAYEDKLALFAPIEQGFERLRDGANAAGDAMLDFLSNVGALATFETQMGKFESEVVGNLQNIEEQLDSAFDNGFLLEESYRNLQSYARDEFLQLQKIAKQRDDLLNRRNLADALLKDVKNATLAAGNITNLLKDTQTETQKVDMMKVVQETVQAGKNLKDFRVTIISDFVEPIEEAASKSDLLVSGFQSVVDRTRLFVDNLKALRELGLDPLLFNQLVEAGVEAGSETAQALIDGGADTVNEVNALFGELDALGQELGEQTAQVMYGEGQEFVNGIIDGLDSMLEELESTAVLLADTFVSAFSSVLEAGIAKAIAAAQAAMEAQRPAEPVYKTVEEEIAKATEELEKVAEVVEKVTEEVTNATGGGTGTGTGGGSGTGSTKDTEVVAQSIKDLGIQTLSKSDLSAIAKANKTASSMYTSTPTTGFGFVGGYGQQKPNITLNVTANTKTQGASAGQAIVKELNTYFNSSGTAGGGFSGLVRR